MTDSTVNSAIAILTTTDKASRIQTVNARDLHKALGVKTNFRDWVKRTIKALGLVEGVDFIRPELRSDLSVNTGRGRRAKEYHLTLSSAQRVTVSGNTDTGKAIWDYLKEAEAIALREAAESMQLARRRMVARIAGTPTNKSFNTVLTESREREGKATQGHHHANEARMVDSIVLGRDSYAVKREMGLKKGETVRDRMTERQLRVLKMLEEHNKNLLQGAMDLEGWAITRESRKRQLQFLHDTLTLMR